MKLSTFLCVNSDFLKCGLIVYFAHFLFLFFLVELQELVHIWKLTHYLICWEFLFSPISFGFEFCLCCPLPCRNFILLHCLCWHSFMISLFGSRVIDHYWVNFHNGNMDSKVNVSALNLLILIALLWFSKRISLFLGNTLKI